MLPMLDHEFLQFVRVLLELAAVSNVELVVPDPLVFSRNVATRALINFLEQKPEIKVDDVSLSVLDYLNQVDTERVRDDFMLRLVQFATLHVRVFNDDSDSWVGRQVYSTGVVTELVFLKTDQAERFLKNNVLFSETLSKPELRLLAQNPQVVLPVEKRDVVQGFVQDFVGFKTRTVIGDVLLSVAQGLGIAVDDFFSVQQGVGVIGDIQVAPWFGMPPAGGKVVVGPVRSLVFEDVPVPILFTGPIGLDAVNLTLLRVGNLRVGSSLVLHCPPRMFQFDYFQNLVYLCFCKFDSVVIVHSAVGGDAWYLFFLNRLAVDRPILFGTAVSNPVEEEVFSLSSYLVRIFINNQTQIKPEPLISIVVKDIWDFRGQLLKAREENLALPRRVDSIYRVKQGYADEEVVLGVPDALNGSVSVVDIMRSHFLLAKTEAKSVKNDRKSFITQYHDLNGLARPIVFQKELSVNNWGTLILMPLIGYLGNPGFGKKKTSELESYVQVIEDMNAWPVKHFVEGQIKFVLTLVKVVQLGKFYSFDEIVEGFHKNGINVTSGFMEKSLKMIKELVFDNGTYHFDNGRFIKGCYSTVVALELMKDWVDMTTINEIFLAKKPLANFVKYRYFY